MMMASSSSSSTSSREGQQAPKLSRHNSSFLGAIKNIVTAPFSWFGHADSRADVTGSKRRRTESEPVNMAASGVQEVPTEIIVEEEMSNSDEGDLDMGSRRSKRMRLNSPSRSTKATTQPKSTMRRSSVVPRASSAVLPSSRASRATLSPKRNTQLYPPTIQRTMSIDPPQLASRRDPPSSSFNFGVDVDMVGLDTRDISMPPSPSRLSPRPSFRMRSSMTPQPIQHTLPQRHISEPPPLNALFSNPVFVHPPLQEKEATPIPAPVPTLGTLVESARNVRLPVKHQHASLLFNKSTEDRAQKDVPADRALQQLDIYKTPLLPSRMRSDADSITTNVIPDMFKSRRPSRPVLMSDDRDKSSIKKNKGPVVNETKPYAGEGGMKKLLARAKLEAEKERAKEKDDGGRSMDDTREEASEPSVPLPPPVTSDWFKSAVSGTSASSSGSSLRVGRQKTSRIHIQRPSKSRFSAVYEDEGDDAIEDDERANERRFLEEVAKKVPVFNIPSEFSFAQDTPAPLPSADELQKAKEPPIKILPFSFSKPPPSSQVPKTKESQLAPMSMFGTTSVEPKTTSTPLTPFSFEKPTFSTSTSPATAPSTTNGITAPSFFPTSQVLKEKPIHSHPSVLNFNAPGASPSTSSAALEKPVAAADPNPFWEGKGKEPSIFGGSHATSSVFPPIDKAETTAVQSSVLPPAPFAFGKPSEDKGSTISAPASFQLVEGGPFPTRGTAEEQKPASSPFSFGKATEDKLASTTTATTSITGPSTPRFAFGKSEKPTATTSLPFSLTGEVPEKKPEAPMAPKPSFESSNASTSTTSSVQNTTTTTSLFGELPKAATPFTGVPPPQSTPSPLPFTFGPFPGSGSATTSTAARSTETVKPALSFGSPANTSSASIVAPPPVVEAPKPLFGPFSFGQEKGQPEISSSPFSFSAAPSTSPAIPEVKPASAVPAPFVFGSSSSSMSAPVSAAPPIAFSFSAGGSAGTDVTTKPSFIFGVPSSSAAHPERAVTPPRTHDQEVRMEESPVREMQVNGKALETLPMVNAPFSFASATTNGANGSAVFGGSSSGSTTTPFAFGAPSTTSNPFGTKKLEESKRFGGFGGPQAPPINTSFSFGQDESRPTSAFTFQTPTSATNPIPTFSFGAPTNASSNPFASAISSAPGSPSTFAQQVPFSFGAPATTASGFAFGSQPSSPAGANIPLPPPTISTTTTFGSGGGFVQTPSPASPFSTPLPLAQSTSSGGTLFTIGAAPVAPPVGHRQIKKLPRRGQR